ncbi:putative Hercynine oxygenase [Rubrivivax sp. A210]|uniref:selenoneine synthase SenA n=1 Tax=Rubrivivax sp. A210 TaxID=2772301 RepID=UPI0019196CBE|nr:selenoneine synthase SenA [Rubrivivax sp. A210]CAD5373644.1 putative Hercynine oxygenase [Rubrivivax sp. A210]
MNAEGRMMRGAGRQALAQALRDSRRDTLAAFAVFEQALHAGLTVACTPELNPPLWELGHVGWFQSWFVARNSQRERGPAAEAQAARRPAARAGADDLYNSSLVPHGSRWQLPLPDADATRADLSSGLDETLDLLDEAEDDSDSGLYFHRLALFHEDMHGEAAVYMAQTLAIDHPLAAAGPPPQAQAQRELHFDAGPGWLGSREPGFAFDNELGAHEVALPACRIDSRAVCWGEFLPFVEAGGYADARWWPGAAGRWRAAQAAGSPRHLRREGGAWQQRRGSRWQALDPAAPACHLTAFEAEAWCSWAGRRLPTEAEWERAAAQGGAAFAWGAVWEWTASPFAPYPGFRPHPYADYSAPWFGSRRVLRGASFATQPRLRHACYRNFFPPERNDIYAGFRSCAR